MSGNPNAGNPVKQLKQDIERLRGEWTACKDLLHDFKEHFREWVDEHDNDYRQRDKVKLRRLCDILETDAPAICDRARNIRSRLAQVRNSHPGAVTYYQSHRKEFKKPWDDYLADSKTDLDRVWNTHFRDVPDGQLVANVNDTVRHCKEVTPGL